jgi:hypothetical protein
LFGNIFRDTLLAGITQEAFPRSALFFSYFYEHELADYRQQFEAEIGPYVTTL